MRFRGQDNKVCGEGLNDHQSACAAAWLLGWRVANEGIVLPDTDDADYVRRMAHFRTGRSWVGGGRKDMEALAQTMGQVPEEEL